MSDSKFTPGPWTWSEDRFHGGYTGLYDAYDNPIVVPQCENDGDCGAAWFGDDEEYYGDTALKDANAHLIAAAPELYGALNRCVHYLKCAGHDRITADEIIAEAEAALKKARGEQ